MAGAGMAMLSAEWHTYYAGWCDKLDGQDFSTFDTCGEFSYSAPEPYGVIGIIITWNGPLIALGRRLCERRRPDPPLHAVRRPWRQRLW